MSDAPIPGSWGEYEVRVEADLAAFREENAQLRKEARTIRAENERLREALKECADELEDYVEAHYAKTKDYPSEARRYKRDIDPVRQARSALSNHTASAEEKAK